MSKVITAAVIGVLGALGLATSSFAARIETQAPCTPPAAGAPAGNTCRVFTEANSPKVLRRFQFTTPAGKALLQFHGTLACQNSGAAPAVVAFTTGIVENGTLNPKPVGPGTLSHGATIQPKGAHPLSGGITFNLATTRVITYATGGLKTVFYNLEENFMSPGVQCAVGNGYFSVVIAP